MTRDAARRVLVIEDDANIRNNIMLMLKVENYLVSGAENGRAGLDMVRSAPPDLILCDVMMPELDGFEVLETLRAEQHLADIPFIFLTALDDRSNARRGMNLGADDYIAKPFTRDELLEAVSSRLKKHETVTQVLTARLVPQQDRLTERFRDEISGGDGAAALEVNDPVNVTGKIANATVVFSDIRHFTTFSERLDSGEIADLLNAYFHLACEPIVGCGGRVLKFIGDGVVAIFEGDPDANGESHAQRALRASIAMQLAALRFREWINTRHASRGLPEFAIGVGVHTGELLLCHLGAAGQSELTAIGDTVNIASRLEGQTKELGWAIAASDATVTAAGPAVTIGTHRTLQLRGRSAPTEAYEIIGIGAHDASRPPVQLPEDLREALAANARVAAGAFKAALGQTLRMLTGELDDPLAAKQLTIQGHRIISRIGYGGSSVVYLAERERDGKRVVLKILRAKSGQDEALLQRFMREFDIISSIDHPNVVKIYDRGFSEDHAYIAMEYFPGGSLADLVVAGLTGRQALSLLAQAANALREIHGRGILHRDVKPANLMVRADGSIALTDFGIAKRLGDGLGSTRHGELFGTPYYVSPEQIEGKPATAQSDIYSLGIIFYELLMRERPFDAESVSELIAMHVTARRPRLPATLAEYQELLDNMLAVDPRRRYHSADGLLEAIDAVWTRRALQDLQNRD